MNTNFLWIRFLIGCLLFVLLTGCTTTTPEIPTLEPTVISTQTSIPPTPSLHQPIEVTFDGNECTVSGPTEIPTGNYPFVWNDLSEQQNTDFWVSRLLDGKTFQDLLDLQSEPGEYFPKPSWVVHSPGYYSFTAEVWVIILDEVGEHAIYLGGKNPLSIWHCASFQVFEDPSE